MKKCIFSNLKMAWRRICCAMNISHTTTTKDGTAALETIDQQNFFYENYAEMEATSLPHYNTQKNPFGEDFSSIESGKLEEIY